MLKPQIILTFTVALVTKIASEIRKIDLELHLLYWRSDFVVTPAYSKVWQYESNFHLSINNLH